MSKALYYAIGKAAGRAESRRFEEPSIGRIEPPVGDFTPLRPSGFPELWSDLYIYAGVKLPWGHKPMIRSHREQGVWVMPSARIINWDDVTLPFGKDSPSECVPTVNHLRVDVGAEIEWHWYYRGLLGIITLDRMKNALAAWDAVQMQRHRREPVPESVGVFRWSDVISMEERQKLAESGTAENPAPSGKAD